jgi:UDP-glucuronate 4-epimerase
MIFITGTAGFIGFHLTKTLLEKGESVVGFDSINDYYDDSVKYARLAELGLDPAQAQEMGTHVKSEKYDCFTFVR